MCLSVDVSLGVGVNVGVNVGVCACTRARVFEISQQWFNQTNHKTTSKIKMYRDCSC